MDQGAESLSLFEQDQQKKEALELDSEINRIAENVTNLHALFKQMNEVVHEQGQVVDRIDFNIEQALVKTKKGNKHLEKVTPYFLLLGKGIRRKQMCSKVYQISAGLHLCHEHLVID